MKKNFCTIKQGQKKISGDKGVNNRGKPVTLPHFSFRSIADDAEFQDKKGDSSLNTAFANFKIVVTPIPKKLTAKIGEAQVPPEHSSLLSKDSAQMSKGNLKETQKSSRLANRIREVQSPVSSNNSTLKTKNRKRKSNSNPNQNYNFFPMSKQPRTYKTPSKTEKKLCDKKLKGIPFLSSTK